MGLKTQRGQHAAEFGLLMGTVALIAVAVQPLARHAVSRGVRAVTDQVLGPQLLRAIPSTIDPKSTESWVPKSSVLEWNVPGAGSCTASEGRAGDGCSGDAWVGPKQPSGTLVVCPDRTTTYRLVCDNGVNQSVTVTIGQLTVTATQALDIRGTSDARRITDAHDRVSGSSVNEDARLQGL